jgi:hypothetical protein
MHAKVLCVAWHCAGTGIETKQTATKQFCALFQSTRRLLFCCNPILITDRVYVLHSTDKAFVKNLYDALAVDERRIWVDWEVSADGDQPIP